MLDAGYQEPDFAGGDTLTLLAFGREHTHLLDLVLITGGHQLEGHQRLFPPTVIGGASLEMDLSKEEIFGPVAPIYRFEEEQEALQLANATPFGLAAYFYGRDYARCWRVAEQLDYGMVGINTGMISTAVAPFGGIKESGFGREGSKYGLEEYLITKYLCWGGVA